MPRKRALLLSAAAVVAAAGTLWIAAPASAAATTAVFTKTSDWGTGWQGDVTITNGGSPLTSWKVEFDLPEGGTVGSFWEADMVADGQHRTFTNRAWNGALPVDGKVSFGFIGTGGDPVNCKINDLPCSGAPALDGGSAGPGPGPGVAVPGLQGADAQLAAVPGPQPDDNQPLPPASDRLPVTITNKSGRSDAVHLYVLGVNLTTGKLGWADAAGTFTPWSDGAAVPVPAPDASIPGPADGASTTIKMPKNLSGRIYMSFGDKLNFRLTSDGLVQPAPWAGGDPSRDILFDWTEFTFNDAGLWLNSSQVDMFAVPSVVSVRGGDGRTTRTGELKPGGRQKVIDAIKADPAYAPSIQTRSDGTVLRVLAPGKAEAAGLMSSTYLDPYIDLAWNAYTSKTLTVVPFGDRPDTKFFGRTSGNIMNFTDGTDKVVASFTKPSTGNVWGCDGTLSAPNDLVVGPIARTLCAAMQRTTLGTLDTQPSGKAADFYKGEPSNHYAKVIHDQMADGKAYAFAFDDVQNQESLVHSGDPRQAGIVISPF
ncbi:beta-1,3-glucanase family protein [Pseudosporangium ferrugineum]|uniref:Cellulose binding domain-containing protein n=1 Tax=Pseudosporangium ferrugineum TaxID=439699 RepID=A0A2T0RNJ6_9ACTN|nr:beta-1,3-glucanase family protein [Pseudosporangium ferrugineum]PRY22765.1 cellulose binding domain-containing protein [Pseudosporangium ferrugineum]